eukprot:TRINITY_DN998_c0_g1_i1.p1 TRINITY_DN998_c0_g1~~TRINITY_DN998_c0_g1_i1.p1  ORF type:complete len:229 (-),score=40.35 TRINITY_DN998_c0_g1_i1:132-818(-)
MWYVEDTPSLPAASRSSRSLSFVLDNVGLFHDTFSSPSGMFSASKRNTLPNTHWSFDSTQPLPKSIGTEGLGVQYGGGKDCGSTPRQTTIYIKCGESQFKAISASEPKGSCVYTITIESTAGCAASGSGSGSGSGVIPTGGGSTGGSTGSSSGSFLGWFWGWLVIILFVLVVVVYLVAGGVYKFKVLEERGLEVVPNIDFWRDVPSLVKDGSVFGFHAITCHKLDSNY